MIKRHQTIVVNFNGGIVSPGYLLNILDITEAYKITDVSFNLRQQLCIEVPVSAVKAFLQDCKKQHIEAAPQKQLSPNIFSSYVSTDIFCEDTWVTEGVYKDVLALLAPSVRRSKVNICNPGQSFVPLYTGHINWIAAAETHYWHLYLRFPGTDMLYHWPELVYTNDLATVTIALEQHSQKPANQALMAARDGAGLYQKLRKQLEYIAQPAQTTPVTPAFHLPYYEGFNRYGSHYWLGIYRRDELFPVPFLQKIARLCLNSRIGELHATPWKSIIIKNIQPAQRPQWDSILGRYRINVRHAANELNWWVEDGNEDALVVKRHVIRYFDKEDVRTYGLCFGVLIKNATPAYGSVLIRQKEGQTRVSLKSQVRYDIYYSEDFNPNAGNYILFREAVAKDHLGPYLVSISKLFYEQAASRQHLPEAAVETPPSIQEVNRRVVYQCNCCTTIYDPQTGDPQQGIAAHTPFEQLPADYSCYTCMAPVEQLSEVLV